MYKSAYSPVEHVSKSVNPSKSWGETLLAMMTVYFDASGKEKDSLYFVVAGFISSTAHWMNFSEQWKRRLVKEGVSCFHAVDAQNRGKKFKDVWNGLDEDAWHAKRGKLWNDLISILAPNVFQKFACGVHIKDYSNRVSEESRRRGRINAYVICAMACAQRVRLWARRQDMKTPIEYIFDENDEGWGLLQESFKNDGFPAPIPKNKCDQIKKDIKYPAIIPLQAADFLAYECFIAHKIVRLNRPRTADRPIVRFQKEIDGDISYFSDMGLTELNEHFKKRIPFKRGNIWRYS